MRKPPRATSATALVTTSPLVPVTASFLCWGAGVGVAEGVGSLYRSITGVGSGTGRLVVGLGVGVTDGVARRRGCRRGRATVPGLVPTDSVQESSTGSVPVWARGSAPGLESVPAVGAGVGVLSNPALPPDSRRTTRVLTSQDLSWEVIDAMSVHGPGSVALTLMFSSTRAFSPALRVALSVALSLVQLVMPGSMKRSY